VNPTLKMDETVAITWGISEVLGTVREVYGRAPRVYVVVNLSPELSSYVVDEPTTVALPLADVPRLHHEGPVVRRPPLRPRRARRRHRHLQPHKSGTRPPSPVLRRRGRCASAWFHGTMNRFPEHAFVRTR